MVDNYFTVDELEPIKKDIEVLVDFLATRLHEEGKLQSWYIAAILSTIGCISYSVLLAELIHFKLSKILTSFTHVVGAKCVQRFRQVVFAFTLCTVVVKCC